MSFTITPILTGVRNPDQGIMTYQQGYGKRIWLPIWAFLVQGQGKNILVDTGLDEDELFVPESFRNETGLDAVSLQEGLEQHGIKPEEIDIVINTHLHDDHCGNNKLFKNAEFYVRKEELAFCRSPHPLDHRYDEYFIEENTFVELEEDVELLPGLDLLFSPGHTVGCMSVVVETESGKTVITGFCCNEENFPETGPAICPGVHLDALKAWDSIQKIKKMDIKIMPMHSLELQPVK